MPVEKQVPWTPEQVVQLAKDLPTPFHIYHEEQIRGHMRRLKQAFSWCQDYRNHFAVKATPNPFLLRLLKEEGCGTDCSSIAELVLSEEMGFKGEEIMFTSNNTPLKEYRKAKELGAVVNFDDLTHVDFLHAKDGLPDMVSFRYNPGPERQGKGNIIIGHPQDAKFGCTKAQLLEGYKKCKELGVKRFGLHTMMASNCQAGEELVETAVMLFTVAKELKEKLDIQVELINLGGGFGIPYRPTDNELDVEFVGNGIREAYKELIEGSGLGPLRVVTECGRHITGPAGYLFSRVTHRKRIYKNYVQLDACMANLMRPGMYNAYHHISIFSDDREHPDLPSRSIPAPDNSTDKVTQANLYDVVGGLCENNDKFAVDRELEVDPLPGDVAVIHDAGAHGHSMGFQYNGKLRSAEYLYRPDGSVLEIRRAETLEDLFATLDMKAAKAFGSA
mmetsp:Transcript_73825/g.153843  ORF Transcript_73825/g.153843 Transcript_73825/m.153843 type:complete len:446 (-) Transcript_73825:399-1736(-)